MRVRWPVTAAAFVGTCLFTSSAFSATTTVAGFDEGSNDGFMGNALFEAAGGNPGGAARHVTDLFFNELRTGALGEPANPAFLGDYSSYTDVEFSVDVKTNMLDDFIGNPIARPVGVMLIDRDIQGPDGASGVFFEMGILGVGFTPDWTNLSVTIADPTSPTLPAGWIGFGDTDLNTFEPKLPAGASFASVLAGVDEFRITGAVPGFFFGSAFWDVQVDNIAVTVPEPGTASLLLVAALPFLRRRML